MEKENIVTKIELDTQEMNKVAEIVNRIEDASPSDALVFFRLDKVQGKYVGSLEVKSYNVDIEVAEEDFDMENLLDILNTQCREKIDDWKKKRDFKD